MTRLGMLLLLILSLIIPAGARAERPTAMQLFPSRTIFFVRFPGMAELVEVMDQSAFFQDPEIRPFLSALYRHANESWSQNTDVVRPADDLSETLAYAQGELAFAVIPRPNEGPAFLLLIDGVRPEARAAEDTVAIAEGQQRMADLIERFRLRSPDWGASAQTEQVGSAEALVLRKDDNASNVVGLIERAGVLLFCTDKIVLESIINRWDEAEGLAVAEPTKPVDPDQAKRVRRLRARFVDPLAENKSFSAALRECAEHRVGGGDNIPPDAVFFFDPVGLVRMIAQEQAAVRVALATFPALGLDGLDGIAGAGWVDTGDWDSLIRGHLLLDTPRAGILKMLRLTSVETTPGEAIPADVSEYFCGGVDFSATYDGASELYDLIAGEGEFGKLVEDKVTKRIGVAPEAILERLTGRLVSVQGYGATPDGATPRMSPTRALLFTVNDPDGLEEDLVQIFERVGLQGSWRDHGAASYYIFFDLGEAFADAQQPRRRRAQIEATGVMTCFALLDDQLIFSQNPIFMEKLLETQEGLHPRLADHLPFRLTVSRVSRLGADVATSEGRVVTYTDPTPQFTRWLEAAESEEARTQLDQLAERAPPMRWLRDALDETETPPLETLLKYFTPSGGALFDTPTGFRYVGFTFKASDE